MNSHSLEEAGLAGLFRTPRSLPMWLLYDEVGCELYEQITRLPEYYLTRTEAEILTTHAAEICNVVGANGRFAVIEIGAGSATKTEILLHAAIAKQTACTFLACDIAENTVAKAALRIQQKFPSLDVRSFVGTHLEACSAIAAIADRQVLLFLGSSIGNYPDAEAVALLRGLRAHLREDAFFILGTDLRKDANVLQAAYNDSAGVTARFTKNVLTRLNREYGADFDLTAFRHVARWNEAESNIEVGVESTCAQTVQFAKLGTAFTLAAGEHIHLETCAKYSLDRVKLVFELAGFEWLHTYSDSRQLYGVQLARARALT